tara:strand:- start:289 stop:465 length:177 start_codon:yes stop_codon:yes gene_type:complete
MDDELLGGFFAGIAVIGFLALLFCFGLDQGETSVQKKCDAYGKAKIGDVMYECKKVTT